MSQPKQLNYWKNSWLLQPEQCPCDVDFISYLRDNHINDKVIFHFGTGEHHIVGRDNMSLARPNHIVAVTASRREYDTYIDFVIDNPEAANFYKVSFVDIYTLNERVLPRFDLVTLFHLCEFYKEHLSSYAAQNDETLLEMFISLLRPNGRLLFYDKSVAANQMHCLVKLLEDSGRLIKEEVYKSLLVCRPD